MGAGTNQLANRVSAKVGVALLLILGLMIWIAIPSHAGAESSLSTPGMTLVFGEGKAESFGDAVAVPVECLGEGHGFCSGVVTLSRDGHHSSVPFSVQGGSHESLFVPFHPASQNGRPARLHGVARTDQSLGPASSSQALLYLR